jgi:hypothetical protein
MSFKVAHALLRAVSRIISTRFRVGTSADAARISACATLPRLDCARWRP